MESRIAAKVKELIKELYGIDASFRQLIIQKTSADFEGDYTVVVFPFTKAVGKPPAEIGRELGERLQEELDEVSNFNVIKGFVNLIFKNEFWGSFLKNNFNDNYFGLAEKTQGKPVVIEFSSPNTNKPMHLGHIRNNLLGDSISRILKACGYNVKKVNLVNDRGIHICQSMLAWQKWGKGETPQSVDMKGDQFVGKYYVLFDEHYKAEVEKLKAQGFTDTQAREHSELMQEAREMLRKWEQRDDEVMKLWNMMNRWVYEGFDTTYNRMGITFDKMYYESQTYLHGRELVKEGLNNEFVYKKQDGSVWADFTDENLDEKLLLRKDGTSVYMTQDLGTAQLRYQDFDPSRMIYVVGNEQDYHFNVLKIILRKLGKSWSELIEHLSYGMVELPYGKMKSREGTIVDADDLMEEMYETARKMTHELGKIDDLQSDEALNLYNIISLGALKFFILKVDPRKNMFFSPEESINFNGNTGPFIQYTHARIKSLLKKSGIEDISFDAYNPENMLDAEKEVLRKLIQFSSVVEEAGQERNPSPLANYIFELVKLYNQFYQDIPVLKIEDQSTVNFRLAMSMFVAKVVQSGMELLGIEVPDKM